VVRMVCEHSARKRAAAEASGFKVILRNRDTTLQDMVSVAETHFGLKGGSEPVVRSS
jgi:hypothetical protein